MEKFNSKSTEALELLTRVIVAGGYSIFHPASIIPSFSALLYPLRKHPCLNPTACAEHRIDRKAPKQQCYLGAFLMGFSGYADEC